MVCKWTSNSIYQISSIAGRCFDIIKAKQAVKLLLLMLNSRMELQNKDIDEPTYIKYILFWLLSNNLIASGLIYPLSKKIDSEYFHIETLYGDDNHDVRFVIDGVFVFENQIWKN